MANKRRGWAGGLRKPVSLAIDEAGNVYILDRDTSRIEILDPNGQKLDALGPVLPGGVELKRPLDVTVDGAGRIFLIEDKPAGLVVVE
jgi:glucose/arabinose dehydrogenase